MNKKFFAVILIVFSVFTKVSAQTNDGLEQFPGGEVGAALVDNNGRIAAVVGTRNQ